VVVLGAGLHGILGIAAALELGAGRVIAVGTPDQPRLRLARQFGTEATVDPGETGGAVVEAIIRETVGGPGADVVLHAAADPGLSSTGLEILRPGGAFLDLGLPRSNGVTPRGWARIGRSGLAVLGADGLVGRDVAASMQVLHRARTRYPFAALHTAFPFTEDGIAAAFAALDRGEVVSPVIHPSSEQRE